MISLKPAAVLVQQIDRAVATVEHAHTQLHQLWMLDLARIVRDVFPRAEHVVIDTARALDPAAVQLVAILDGSGVSLWSAPPPCLARMPARKQSPVATYRTTDGEDWDAVLAQLEFLLTKAADVLPPAASWTPVFPVRTRRRDEFVPTDPADTTNIQICLPSRETVAAAEQPDDIRLDGDQLLATTSVRTEVQA